MTASWRAESRRVEPVRVSGENDTPVEKKSGIRESGSLYWQNFDERKTGTNTMMSCLPD